MFASGKALDEVDKRRKPAEAALEAFVALIRTRLYDDRVAMLPADVQTIVRKSERQRTGKEQKIADDYFPILRKD